MPTVYITAPPEAADELAETLVEERLAACVNRLSTTSTYRWEGDLHRDDEVVLLAKTTDDAYDDLVDRVRDSHPYDVPCIERFDESDVLESFAAWRTEHVD
ncbi:MULTISPECIES: divalent-cation tolerance protein CutA [unclassified Natrinema]|uniref:divalent-cation tolerance protein CutA n=1 Tax=unclassified Natrinema TaxID=2622230 RepID=UPI00026D439F|nr:MULTISPECIES: divalent-cation tolerance protein CutA [unclassified Natrinema]AFO58270.1 CutA1 divalent ion tolerance protein [Natrinema sp. J7-2]